VTRGRLPQKAGSLGLNGGGAAAAVPPFDHIRDPAWSASNRNIATIALQLSWNRHVASWQKLRGENYGTSATWFERIISARTFYIASLPEKDAEEDHGDAGQTMASNGQAYPLQSVLSSQRTEARGEPWCPCQ